MVKVDLITGFLGAGKTTFIQGYLKFLRVRGEKVHIIENEFGSTGVDSHLIEGEIDDTCKMSDLAGMCMCCIGKKAFINMLIESANTGCDRIVVEPSGIYDVDEFFDVLSDRRVCALCEIGSIITIVDPLSEGHLTDEATYLMFAQLLASGTVVYSKTQLIDEDRLNHAIGWTNQIMIDKGCESGILADICTKSWSELTDSDFEDMQDSGYNRLVHDREAFNHSEVFQSTEVIGKYTDRWEITQKVKRLFSEEEFGKIFRVKGFVRTELGDSFEVNCTGEFLSVEETTVKAECLVIIGQHIKERAIQRMLLE